jgi:hypothetical protein
MAIRVHCYSTFEWDTSYWLAIVCENGRQLPANNRPQASFPPKQGRVSNAMILVQSITEFQAGIGLLGTGAIGDLQIDIG